MMEAETINDGLNPSWESNRERRWDELSDIEKAARIAKRLLAPMKVEGGKYMQAHADEDLKPSELVTLDKDGTAKKWLGTGTPNGLVMSTIAKGNYGWVQIKS